jgi:hypothetical protein
MAELPPIMKDMDIATLPPVEISEMKDRISRWVSQESIEKAQELIEGKTKGEARKAIFKNFDNELKPISYIPEQYLPHFNGNATDNKVYSGMAYFVDHAVNHHPEITIQDYGRLHEILTNPDEVIIDRRPDDRTKEPRDNLLFVKYYRTHLIVVVSLSGGADSKILLHKSLYSHKKTPYPNLTRIKGISPGGGLSPIGRATEVTPGGNLSSRDVNSLSS